MSRLICMQLALIDRRRLRKGNSGGGGRYDKIWRKSLKSTEALPICVTNFTMNECQHKIPPRKISSVNASGLDQLPIKSISLNEENKVERVTRRYLFV